MYTSALISLALALTSNAFPLVSTPAPSSSAAAQRRSTDYNVVNVGGAPDPQPIPTSLETVVQTVTLPGAPAQTVTVTVPATPTASPSSSAVWGSSAFSSSPAAYPVVTPGVAARGYSPSSSAAWGTSASGLVARAFSSPSSLVWGSSSSSALAARDYTPSSSAALSTSTPASPTVTPELAARWASPSSSQVWSTSAPAYPTASPVLREEPATRGLDRLARAFGRSIESQLKVIEGNLARGVKARGNETAQLTARGLNQTQSALYSRGLFNTTASDATGFQARNFNGTVFRA